eukprot:jgi/Orpsp1_1/1183757/evm.model.c7180000086611.1
MVKSNLKLLLLCICTAGYASAGKHAFKPIDLVTVNKIPSVSVSPDSQFIVYDVNKYFPDTNKKENNLFISSIKSKKTYQLTNADDKASTPFWLNNNTLAFFSSRSGSSQIWYTQVDLDNLGLIKNNTIHQLTKYPADINNFVYNSKAKRLVFSAQAYVKNGKMVDEDKYVPQDSNKYTSGLTFDSLFIRHWDTFKRPKVREQIFVADLEVRHGKFKVKKEVNIMKGEKMESPVTPFGDAGDFNVSPDGKTIAFSSRVEEHEMAWNTNTNIYTVQYPIGGKPKSIENLTAKNPGYDTAPRFSPDGKWLAYFEMKTKSFESDVNRLKLYNLKSKKHTELKLKWDRSPDSLTWSHDSTQVYLTAPSLGRGKVYVADLKQAIKAINAGSKVPSVVVKELIGTGNNSIIDVIPKGALKGNKEEILVLSRTQLTKPFEIYQLEVTPFKQLKVEDESPKVMDKPPKSEEALVQITNVNKKFRKEVKVNEPEEFYFKGYNGDLVHGWLIKPHNYVKGKKYPLAYLIHGGPQGDWKDTFSTGWNPQIYAGAGYVTVAINFHGSTGFGEKFQLDVSKHWGEGSYKDLMLGLDYVLEKNSYIDKKKVCGLGGSYGGFMVNWINGHTDRFNCLVNHDGIFDTIDAYFTTEELFFNEYEFGGSPFDKEAKKLYDKWNPREYAKNWKTPTLIIHGAKDYRLADTQGIATFTALQRLGVDSKLVYFPDENHWVLKPANVMFWFDEILGWLDKYTK